MKGHDFFPVVACLGLPLVLFLGSAGCSGGSDGLGEEPGPVTITLEEAKHSEAGRPLNISGILVEKCPEAGCWFVLRDGTGTLKVDTKAAGFVVVDVPLFRALTVKGRILKRGSETLFEATGVRY